MNNSKELKVYKLDQLLDLQSKEGKHKIKFQLKFPFITRVIKYEEYTDYARTKYLVASSEDEAEKLFRERNFIYNNSDDYYFRYYREKMTVLNNEYTVKQVQISIDSLKELVRAEDFIKYFTYYNMRYQDLF